MVLEATDRMTRFESASAEAKAATAARRGKRPNPVGESVGVRLLLTGLALAFLALVLLLPLVAVFVEAFRKGPAEFFRSLNDPDTFAAIRLTLAVAAIAVPINLVFGVVAACRTNVPATNAKPAALA